MKKIKFFTEAWYFLQDHPLIGDGSSIEQCLNIDVVKVNPKTCQVDKNDNLNTETEVWLEFGFPEYKDKKFLPTAYFHDIRLDCGAETFEQVIVILANLVKKHYETK